MAKSDLILLALDDSPVLQLMDRALRAVDYSTAIASDQPRLDRLLQESTPIMLIVGNQLNGKDGFKIAETILDRFPTLPVILFAEHDSPQYAKQVLRIGICGYLHPPLHTDDIVQAVKTCLERANRTGDWIRREVRKTTASLEKRVNELEALVRLGTVINSSLDVDDILKNVVAAAVELTGAEEGSLLTIDDERAEFTMRAGHNFDADFVQAFQVPVQGSLPGQAILEGKPLVLNESTQRKIATGFLVTAIVYVPLRIKGKSIGVLSVDNRTYKKPFTDHDALLMTVLADYAASAMENARLYSLSEVERIKFEATFSNLEDGVIILDMDRNILMANQAMCSALQLSGDAVRGKPFSATISHPDLNNLLSRGGDSILRYHEVNFDDGRVFNAQYAPIPGVGSAITMQDITYLKELDRLKNDFVHTVSHDLRSPLTSILGYTELLERAGTLSEQQREFVQRIQSSVQNITTMVNDLLDLGRIEAGFDSRRELVKLDAILRYTLDSLELQISSKKINMSMELSELPPLKGNPIRLRQMLDNLLSNAVKYTPVEGNIWVNVESEDRQIIIEVRDTGPGIPPADQPYIFDKFYRASNVPTGTPGSGLGLAIVKSIVEGHQGRIWVESTVGQGTKFVVVLPAYVAEQPTQPIKRNESSLHLRD
jgi:two-component system NtrC family sensor kinase